jgi:DNA-binding GntR family transcriptional regulator
MLELHSVAMAVINATPEHISTFKSILKDLKKLTAKPEDHAKAVKLDMDIHKLIALAAGNKSLQEAMNNVLDKLMCFVAVEIADQNALATAYKEHKMLLGLIEQRDVKGAVNLMRSHIDNAQNNLVRVFQTRDEFKKSILSATLSTAEKAFATDRRVHLGDVR